MHVLAVLVPDNQSPKQKDTTGSRKGGLTFYGTGPQNDGHDNCLLMGQAEV